MACEIMWYSVYLKGFRMALMRSTASTRYHMLDAIRVKVLTAPSTMQPYILFSSLRSAIDATMCPKAIRKSSIVLGGRGSNGLFQIIKIHPHRRANLRIPPGHTKNNPRTLIKTYQNPRDTINLLFENLQTQ